MKRIALVATLILAGCAAPQAPDQFSPLPGPSQVSPSILHPTPPKLKLPVPAPRVVPQVPNTPTTQAVLRTASAADVQPLIIPRTNPPVSNVSLWWSNSWGAYPLTFTLKGSSRLWTQYATLSYSTNLKTWTAFATTNRPPVIRSVTNNTREFYRAGFSSK